MVRREGGARSSTAETPTELPDGADGWHLSNGRIVYPAEAGFVAADSGGWLEGARSSVGAWLTDD